MCKERTKSPIYLIKKILIGFLIIAFLSFIVYIIGTDMNNSAEKPGGAGEIWWVNVPEIEEAYQHLSEPDLN